MSAKEEIQAIHHLIAQLCIVSFLSFVIPIRFPLSLCHCLGIHRMPMIEIHDSVQSPKIQRKIELEGKEVMEGSRFIQGHSIAVPSAFTADIGFYKEQKHEVRPTLYKMRPIDHAKWFVAF